MSKLVNVPMIIFITSGLVLGYQLAMVLFIDYYSGTDLDRSDRVSLWIELILVVATIGVVAAIEFARSR